MLNSPSRKGYVLYLLKTDRQPFTINIYIWIQGSLKTSWCQVSAVLLSEKPRQMCLKHQLIFQPGGDSSSGNV